jgi:hypothetical protein
VLLGNSVAFSASVSNSSNSSVIWSVSGVAGGNPTLGSISTDGVYTAPAVLPSPATITIAATSAADPAKSASASVTVTSDLSLTLSPANAGIELGAQQAFQAAVISAGRPSSKVLWTLNGPGCTGARCGTVNDSGVVTAPQILPSPASEILTATSVADPSRQVSAILNITSNFSLNLAGPSSLVTGDSADYVATLIPAANSIPDSTIQWSLSGNGCVGVACGTLSISASGTTATYSAPVSTNPPGAIHIRAIPLADPSKSVTLEVTLQSPITLAPSTSIRAIGHRQRLSATVLNADTRVNWFVNGVPGGTSSLGQICVADSSPCQPVLSALAGEVDYLAPATVPAPNPVTITIVSAADPSRSASSAITVLPHLVVSVSPPAAMIAPGESRRYTADVAGTSNQQVVWQISGAACGSIGNLCGAINPAGVYAAPAIPPSPNVFSITATSSEDTSRMGAASVSILTVPTILSLLPSSILNGGPGGITLRVEGGNFVPSSPGPGSFIRVDGSARATQCDSPAVCWTTLTGGDIALSGNHSIQIQNPNGTLSAAVSLITVSETISNDQITLSASAPDVSGKNIIVVDLTTSGSSLPADNVNLNIISLSQFQPLTGSCAIAAGPVALVRPASGTTTAHLCAFSVSGLDASFTYTFSGPADLAVIGKEPVGLGIVHLTASLPSMAQIGARSMFVENANHDVTTATGAVDVR